MFLTAQTVIRRSKYQFQCEVIRKIIIVTPHRDLILRRYTWYYQHIDWWCVFSLFGYALRVPFTDNDINILYDGLFRIKTQCRMCLHVRFCLSMTWQKQIACMYRGNQMVTQRFLFKVHHRLKSTIQLRLRILFEQHKIFRVSSILTELLI